MRDFGKARSVLSPVIRPALDLVLPPRCPITREPVTAPGELSSRAWADINFIGQPECAICGYPFEFDRGKGAICGPCAAHKPAFRQARSVFRYEGVGRDLVLALKHGDRTELAPLMGRWLGARLPSIADPTVARGNEGRLIVPIPLHRWRLLRRRFNQSGLLALGLARHWRLQNGEQISVEADLLVRCRNTPAQSGDRTARRRNIRHAFEVRRDRQKLLDGANVLLVDDVYTTGATLEECTRVLIGAGAADVAALTLSRVVRQ